MSENATGPRRLAAEATRRRIVAEARTVFGRVGFDAAPLAEIVAAAAVTTGAVYHHFGDKKGLFLAVAEAVEADLLAGVNAAARAAPDAFAQLTAGVGAMLEICADPATQRIIFIDAPTVIGPERWREIELRYAFGATRRTLERLVEAGEIRRASPDLLAAMLVGALVEAARAVATAADKPAALAEARATAIRLLESLRHD